MSLLPSAARPLPSNIRNKKQRPSCQGWANRANGCPRCGGREISTELIAERFGQWQMNGEQISFVIGGPDGLHQTILQRAIERWSFGRITLPHPLVRVILAEQLYRAWSLQARHPYHRGQ